MAERYMTTEEMAEKNQVYQGLDTDHTPRLFVPERYIEVGSSRLERLAGRALLASQMFPETQFDVVWTGQKVTPRLRAEVQPTGTYNHSWGLLLEGTDEHFRISPAMFERWPGQFSYSGRIEDALKNGAGIFKPADLARSRTE